MRAEVRKNDFASTSILHGLYYFVTVMVLRITIMRVSLANRPSSRIETNFPRDSDTES